MPAVTVRSLIATGTPCRGPSLPRFFTAASASRAHASVFSGTTVQKALTAGLMRSIAARCASAASTGDTFLVRIRRARSTAERRVMSLAMFLESYRSRRRVRSRPLLELRSRATDDVRPLRRVRTQEPCKLLRHQRPRLDAERRHAVRHRGLGQGPRGALGEPVDDVTRDAGACPET